MPEYGLKFAPLAVDGSVDTTAAFFDAHGKQSPDEQDLQLDIDSETVNTVNIKSKNAVMCIQATSETEGDSVHPEDRPRNVPAATPLLGQIPKFTAVMPELAPSEVADDNTVDLSMFIAKRYIVAGKDTNDFSNNPDDGSGSWNAKYSSFGGQILFHPTSSDHTAETPF